MDTKRFLEPDLIDAFHASGLRQGATAGSILEMPEPTFSSWLHGAKVPDGPKSTERVHRLCDLLNFPRERAFTYQRRVSPSLDGLMATMESIAMSQADGHATIFRFTTGWAVGLRTPSRREDISSLPTFRTLKEALREFIKRSA